MQINILFLIIIVLLILGIQHGYKIGLIEGLLRAIALIAGIFALCVVLIGVYNFVNHRVANVLVALILIIAMSLVYKILHLPLKSLKTLAKLPVMKSVDKICGIVIGISEVVIFIWFVFLIIQYMNIDFVVNWVVEQANQNAIVSLLYKSNYLVQLLLSLLSK